MKKKVDMSIVKRDVFNCLGVGKENAISRMDIRQRTGYNDRLIREAIERLRKRYAIPSLTNGKGYYIAAEDAQGAAEAAEWVIGQNRRAKSIIASCRGAQKLVARVQQRRMEECGNG